MKYLVILFFIPVYGFSNMKDSPNDFDYRLSNIASQFVQEIMDQDKCDIHKREASQLVGDIEDALKMDGGYNPDEMRILKKLIKEAEALEEYIACVGDCGNYVPTIDGINLANTRVGGSISTVFKDKFCLDILCVTINDYTSYLIMNNRSKQYDIVCSYKTSNGLYSGNLKASLPTKCIRHLYDNRENPNQKNITVISVTCKENENTMNWIKP